MSTLSVGSVGAEVQLLQRDLSFLGYNVTIDGDFGNGTKAIVTQFQTDHELSADGVVGPNTWTALDNLVPQGLDISHHNGSINWAGLSPHIQFVYCKASQGATFTDPMFQSYIGALKQKQLIYGAYHFLTFQDSAESQVDNFLNCGLDFSAPGTLPPALDIEEQVPDSLNPYILQNRGACVQLISDWLQLVQTRTGRTPVIYSYKSFWKEYLGNPATFGNNPLWIASYQVNQPGLPPGWNDYAIWQYYGAEDESAGQRDQNLIKGGMGALKKLALIG
ncbi:GH25 family lysozyme [Mucilaginibacter ginsenosidivorans]|uniref:Lysozyme n=1 Tax=Mucilaginibacter ginsenosidivorans TaxID=398053 RepID=A0A5B8URR2_9SPHI|nr:GH25 family lysozyme [Mucilaginibacter ginsenosidivorans]QEC61760.1 lysozyme [Mucilaginibacter ginsenosidivorans]